MTPTDQDITTAAITMPNNSVVAPVRALLAAPDDAVLAIISEIDGPSYRPLGAMMTVLDESNWVGSLSSGCIEADIALHAHALRESSAPQCIRYGKGSPFLDMQLPCGGGMEITLLPRPDRSVLEELLQIHDARGSCTLLVERDAGSMSIIEAGNTALHEKELCIRFEPEILFQVFGKGPEASTFAALVQAAGYPNLLLSPDRETLETAAAAGCRTQHLPTKHYPADLTSDARTAIALFFHDHDWEPTILATALDSPAFYIGAQGSYKAAQRRQAELQTLGCTPETLQRLRGPVGLIPSTRDPRTLAVSVLAEVLAEATPKQTD